MKKTNLLNLGLALITTLLFVQNASAEKAKNEDTRTGTYYEYGEGLKVKTPGDEVDLTLNLYNKFKVSVTNTEDIEWWGTGTGTKFYIPQSRLVLDSNFIGGLVNLFAEIDLIGVEERELYRQKAFVRQEVVLNLTPIEDLTFKIGQWTAPGSKEGFDYDDFSLNMEDPSIAGLGSLPELGVGVETSFAGNNLVFGVFNGHNISERKNETRTDYKLAALLSRTLFGEYDRSVSSDINYSKEAALDVGIYGIYDKGKERAADTHYKSRTVGVNGGYKHLGLSAELDVAYLNAEVKGERDYALIATTAKTGYFFVPKKLEGVARFGWLNYHHNVDGATNSWEPALGVNYYIIGEDLRVGTMVSYVRTTFHSQSGDDSLRWLTSLVARF